MSSTSRQAVLDTIDRNKDKAIELLRKMVSIPSVTGDEAAIQAFVADYMTGIGLDVDMWETDWEELKKHPGYIPVEIGYEGRPNIVATLKGTGGGRSLLLNGHTDVIPVGKGEGWSDDPWSASIKDGRIYGRGSCDMKSGVASHILACEYIKAAGIKLKGDVLIDIVIDEEVSGGPEEDEGLSFGLLANTRILGMMVRANATYRVTGPRKGFDDAQLTIERPLDDRSDLRFDIQHDGRERTTTYEAGYVRQFRQLALRVGGTIDSKGSVGVTTGVTFSFGPDPFGHGVRFSNQKLAERGEAAVSVFLDENGDGVRSPGEQPLAGVGLTAGQFGSSEPTDKKGHAVIEGLDPYQKVLIGIDESTLPDPFLVPVGKGTVITPRPGVAAKIEIAVAPTGDVEGEIHGLEDTPRGGIELELVDSAGKTVASVLSEFDGYFTFEKIPYGSYRVQLSAGAARVLGAARELGKTAVLSKAKSEVELGVVRLHASQIAAVTDRPPSGGSP